MFATSRTPLAWKNLTHEWRRLAVAVGGIGFAVLLMLMQIGFMYALFDSPFKVVDGLHGDLFLISKARYAVAAEKRFPIERILQAASCPGVQHAYPIYAERTIAILRTLAGTRPNKGYPIRVIGFDVEMPVFRTAEINAQIAAIRPPRTALIDRQSKRRKFEFDFDDNEVLRTQPAELANQRIQIVGTFNMGTDFAHDGNMIMSKENFASYFPQRRPQGDPLSIVDLGVLVVDEDADVETVKQTLQNTLEEDVFVKTRDEYRLKEKEFWNTSTPIGRIFFAGVLVGFVVGVIICYQIIYSDIADHMSEFATLKAMGYTGKYFVRLIVSEAFLLSLLGFIPGVLIGQVLFWYVANTTGLPMEITVGRASFVLMLTIVMCIASGLLAVRKLLQADPASLF